MALLLSCQYVSKSFGAQALFENLSLTISEGDRLGLIGPNGSGKSTLLQILAGLRQPDSGGIAPRKQLKVGYVPQEPVFPPGRSVTAILEEFADSVRVSTLLSLANFPDGRAEAAALSGGWKRRLSIARALAPEPDLVLLDEPTNHLDLEGILWLEALLQDARFACVMVSHDRYFLENVATTMAELNRLYPDGLFEARGRYSDFLERKQAYLAARDRQEEALATKVRRELEWLRRGPKARTTKSRARIGQAGRLIEQLADVTARGRSSTARIDFTASDRRTKRLLEVEDLEKQFGGRCLFRGLKLTLSPGTRLGLAGANGSGKTTLLRILQGEIPPDAGAIRRADGLRVAYFDQHRAPLDPSASLRRALAPEGDSVIYRDRTVHVAGWAKRFLFRAEQLDMPVERLSGGERARVVIARLMLEPADLLLLDEPTNDLDIPTLEVLEESLADFPGAMVLVTHDRFLLDRVCTAVLGLDGEGGAEAFADYSQWTQAQAARKQVKPVKEAPAARSDGAPAKKRLSYLEAREWEGMERRILEAEQALEIKQAALSAASLAGDAEQLKRCYEGMLAAQREVDELYTRWAALEEKKR